MFLCILESNIFTFCYTNFKTCSCMAQFGSGLCAIDFYTRSRRENQNGSKSCVSFLYSWQKGTPDIRYIYCHNNKQTTRYDNITAQDTPSNTTCFNGEDSLGMFPKRSLFLWFPWSRHSPDVQGLQCKGGGALDGRCIVGPNTVQSQNTSITSVLLLCLLPVETSGSQLGEASWLPDQTYCVSCGDAGLKRTH